MMADGNENRLEQESRGFQTSWMTPSVPDREITGEPVAQTLAKLVVTRLPMLQLWSPSIRRP